MTHEGIVDYLRGRSDAADWSFESSAETARELFYTAERLDMARSKDIRRGSLTVYADGKLPDGGPGRGASVVSVPAGVGAAELAAIVDRALERARFSLSPAWALPAPSAGGTADGSGRRGSGPSLLDAAEALRDAVFSSYAGAGCRRSRDAGAALAASELFLTARDRRVTTSAGADSAWSDLVSEAEFAVLGRGDGGTEVDLVESWSSGGSDPAGAAAAVETLLSRAADRARAQPLGSIGGLPVVISGNALSEFFLHFFQRASAVQAMLGVSDVRIGGPLLSGPASGDALTIGVDPALPGSPENRPADGDGFPLARTVLAENGIVRALEGPARYASWLGVSPVGSCSSLWAAAGSVSAAQREAMDRLEALVFSDFYMNYASGDFGGELRLGVLHSGGKRTAVTGGSISGSIAEERTGFRFSAKTGRVGSFFGPDAVFLKAARVTAAQ